MKVHHISCLSMCPPFARLVNGGGPIWGRGRMECHCLLIETDASGLVLVDTGIGLDDCADPSGRLGREFSAVVIGPKKPTPAATARRQIEAMGFAASDVRHVVLTHLDVDHAGGLPDFPSATVHVMADEKDAAMAGATLNERKRYRSCQWAHEPRWATHRVSGGERWRGFEHVRELNGLPPEILLLPLSGHTRGHACVAVETAEGPLVHCGDAYFHRAAIDASLGAIPLGLRIFETTMALERARIAPNHARLRELAATPGIRLFCAHDPSEYDSLRGTGSVS
jgi:glyoxylase-like metal-dependent hydrolase (beta-lactamase superfamily II)